MSKDSDNHSDCRGTRYSFPCTVAQTHELLHDEQRSDQLIDTLRDEWQPYYESRGKAMVDMVDNICWYAGTDMDRVLAILSEYQLYEKWNGDVEKLEMVVEAQRFKIRRGQHYTNFDY